MRGACAHCELPLGRRPITARVGGEAARFCCFGCALAMQITRARGESGAAAAILVRLGLAIFFAINVMMASMLTYVPYVYGPASLGDGASSGVGLGSLMHLLAALLAAPVMMLLGWPIVAGAWRGVRGGALNLDLLIALGTFAAYGLSLANLLRGRTDVYFDTAAMLLVLVTLGRYLEARARAEASAAMKAGLATAPESALRLRDGGREKVAAVLLVPGDVVEVAPGRSFPTDAAVLEGSGGVDEAALTGESEPVLKGPGSRVAGGTCSIDATFRARVTAPLAESAVARIAALLAAALRERSPVERLADRVAGRLVPAVVGLAAGAGLWWSWHAGPGRGLLVALAVLVVACPCALGIATPVAIWSGLGAAARRGVVLRSAAVLERTATVGRVLFDKTGTLTERRSRLTAIEPAPHSGLDAQALLARAAALERGLAHPLAEAIVVAAAERDLPHLEASDVRLVPGRGVCGTIGGERLALGSVSFAAEELGLAASNANVPHGQPPAGPGAIVLLAGRGEVLGRLHFSEAMRSDAGAAVARLRGLGIATGLLSGDVRAGASLERIFAPEEVSLGLLPADKLDRVRALRRWSSTRGGSRSAIAMVGDGINDAPALAAADVGIAVGAASDLARSTADVLLLGGDLGSVPWLIVHARRVVRVARQNLLWAFAYNAIALVFAASGALNPLVASLAMIASSLSVVANARRAGRAGEVECRAASVGLLDGPLPARAAHAG